MRARALLVALALLSVFAGGRLASGGTARGAITHGWSAGRVMSPVGGEKGASTLGRGAGNATAAMEVGLPARVVDYTPTSTGVRAFPSTDYTDPEAGPRQGSTEWRVVGGTGNAAELWFTVAQSGRVLDLGGRYVIYSDDQGKTWKAVKPTEELVNAEGSVIQAPNGDIVAITWDPYSGDRLITYKYNAAEAKWYYMYQPLHTPFWDRPMIDVVPGPFTDPTGAAFPYLTFVNGLPHDPWQYSYDGLNYPGVSSPSRDRGPAVSSWLDVQPDPMRDYTQILTDGLFNPFAPLEGGKAWSENLIFSGQDMKWHPWTTPDGEKISGNLQIDSRGWLHNVVGGGNGFTYRTSTDGGRTWNELDVEGGNAGDFKANGAAGVAAVAAAKGSSKGVQDLVFKIDISTPQPKLIRTYLVGDGTDSRSGGVGFYGVSGGHRFDFSNVGIFPDGRLAITFMDAKTKMPFPTLSNPATCAIKDIQSSPCEVVAPQMAIEMDTTIPAGS